MQSCTHSSCPKQSGTLHSSCTMCWRWVRTVFGWSLIANLAPTTDPKCPSLLGRLSRFLKTRHCSFRVPRPTSQRWSRPWIILTRSSLATLSTAPSTNHLFGHHFPSRRRLSTAIMIWRMPQRSTELPWVCYSNFIFNYVHWCSI